MSDLHEVDEDEEVVHDEGEQLAQRPQDARVAVLRPGPHKRQTKLLPQGLVGR